MKRPIHRMKSSSPMAALLVVCVLYSTSIHAQMFGGTIMPKRVPVEITPTIPANLTLGQNLNYFVSSIYDPDYLPLGETTIPANTDQLAADGVAEAIILNVQGVISTTGVSVGIPATATGSGVLPAFSSTITVPANLAEDGISRDLNLSWSEQSYTSSTKSIVATLAAVGGVFNAKKLDLLRGMGNDRLGLLLGSIYYPYNNAGNKTPLSVRDISGIPDKMFGIADNSTLVKHNFIYLPVIAEDGKTWLNNNLGADYANVNNASFNPTQQATAYNDHHAYGSIFQWGRKPDGHELISWTGPSAGTPVNNNVSGLADDPSDPYYISAVMSTLSDWRLNSNDALWATYASTNNPCPFGFRIPTQAELVGLMNTTPISNRETASKSKLKLSIPGMRNANGQMNLGTGFTCYWTSTSAAFSRSASPTIYETWIDKTHVDVRANGYPVRCIKD